MAVTPLDVVKIRMQAQQKELFKHKCFLYCNGLMDHICYCNGNGSTTPSNLFASSKWFRRPSHFNGTLVRYQLSQLALFNDLFGTGCLCKDN